MGFIIQNVLLFISRRFIHFLLILLILVLGGILYATYNEYSDLLTEVKPFLDDPSLVDNFGKKIEEYKAIHTKFSEDFKQIDSHEQGRKIQSDIIKERDRLREKQLKLKKEQEAEGPFEKNLPNPLYASKLPDCLRRDLELDLITGLLLYIDEALDVIRTKSDLLEEVETLNKKTKDVSTLLARLKLEFEELTTYSFGRCEVIVILPERKRCSFLKEEIPKLEKKVIEYRERKAEIGRKLASLKAPIFKERYKDKPYFIWFEEKKDAFDELKKTWLFKIGEETKKYAPIAFLILLGVIFTPIIIKSIFYFILSPIASRLKPIRLIPDESGELSLEVKKDSVDADILLDKDQELLVSSDYALNAPNQAKIDTAFFLNNKLPLTCLAAQMVTLTRIRTNKEGFIKVAPKIDAGTKIATIGVQSGAALIIQPHKLVGIVKSKDSQVHISSHWRLTSLHAWLTLQLRYLAFHGPCKLIVQGCGGVRCMDAEDDRNNDQDTTIGFSAGLDYSTGRRGPFFQYLRGKEKLLNDTFKGRGYYIHQVIPKAKKGGSLLFGRGLEGLTDALLKVFGI